MSDWMEMFDAQLALAGPLGEHDLGEIPAKRGVLALLAEGNRPIILLTAAAIRSRLRARLTEPHTGQRKRTVDLRAVTRKVLWKLTFGHFETDLAFFEIARRMWPEEYPGLLAWKPAWFVGVDPKDDYPQFVRSREPFKAGGRHFGPFPDGRSATRFIEALQDAFGLCRHYGCLRQWPHSQRCAYAQMGRCLSPCDGTVSMEDYRNVVAEAADFAAGQREPIRRRLGDQMADAAGQLRFEQAGALKARLGRLGEFEKPAYRHVAPLEEFRYVLVQPGTSRQKAKVFLVNFGAVASAGQLDYPLSVGQLTGTLESMADRAAQVAAPGQVETLRMGLVASYLFCSDDRRGVMLRWTARTTPRQLAEAIEAARDRLKLRVARTHRKTPGGQTESSDPAPRV